jgi:hypothetical protein
LRSDLPILHLVNRQRVSIKNLKSSALYFNNQGRTIAIFSDTCERFLVFSVRGVVTFFWKKKSSCVYYTVYKKANRDLVDYWFIHTALPVFLSFEERYFFLHVGSVLIRDYAIAFMAECGGGKSTLTDFFMKKEHPLVTDDKLGIFQNDGAIFGIPSHPHHRPYRAVETLGEYVENFSNKPSELRIIYVLMKVDPTEDIKFRELRGIEKFTKLRYASEMNYNYTIGQKTSYIASIANCVSTFEISVPWDMKRLEEVYESIIQHTSEIL